MYRTALTAIFLSIILALQISGLPKPILGVIVNAIYIVLFMEGGIGHVFMLAVLSPSLALLTGHLPPPLIPMSPFLALGNIVMILCYGALREKGKMARILAPSIAKALLIALVGAALADRVGGDPATRMAFHIVMAIQFFTAVPGIYLGEYLYSRLSKAIVK